MHMNVAEAEGDSIKCHEQVYGVKWHQQKEFGVRMRPRALGIPYVTI